MRIVFLQLMNDNGTGLIEISLPAVEESFISIIDQFNDRFFNIRFLHLVTIPVADEKSGLFFITHNFVANKKCAATSECGYAKKHAAHSLLLHNFHITIQHKPLMKFRACVFYSIRLHKRHYAYAKRQTHTYKYPIVW